MTRFVRFGGVCSEQESAPGVKILNDNFCAEEEDDL